MKTLLNVILWVWQLPQNLLGLLFILVLRPECSVKFGNATVHFATRMRGGISLGQYIHLRAGMGSPNNICHEYGHSRQSLYLGPLYLLVIGLPSLIHAALYRPEKGNYYDFYTERWADRLGGVKR